MATTGSGLTAPSGPLVVRGPRRRAPLRPLTTGSYQPRIDPPDAAAGGSWPGRLVAYAVPLLVVGVVAGRWFVPGRFFVAAGVPAPLVDDLRPELWSAWSHQLSGGGSSSVPMGRVLEAGVLAGGDWLGLGGPAGQVLTTLAAALYAVWAVVFLARAVVRPVAAALAGLVAVMNPYVLVTLPDVRPLVVVGLAASLGGLVRRVGAGRRLHPLALVAALLPASVLAEVPLALAALGVGLGVSAGAVVVADGRRAARRLLLCGLWAVPLGMASLLWWAVPAALVFGSGREGVELRPGALVTPVAAAVLVPPVALGAAVLVDGRLARAGRAARRSRRVRILVPAAVVALGALAVPLPLWTGSVGDRSVAPDLGWTAVASAVDGSALAGKALVVPDVDRPAVALALHSIRRPVLARPGPGPGPGPGSGSGAGADAGAGGDRLFTGSEGLDRQVADAARLLGSDPVEASVLLDRLGVSHLVVAPGSGARVVAQLRGWRPLGAYGVADVVERVRPAPLVSAVAAEAGGAGPDVSWRRRDAARYDVTIDAAADPFVLALTETFGPGWELTGLPASWTARHGVVDGYANGWRVEGEGRAEVRLVHRPSATARLAAYGSLAALGAATLASLAMALLAGRGRGPAPEGTRPRGCGDANLT